MAISSRNNSCSGGLSILTQSIPNSHNWIANLNRIGIRKAQGWKRSQSIIFLNNLNQSNVVQRISCLHFSVQLRSILQNHHILSLFIQNHMTVGYNETFGINNKSTSATHLTQPLFVHSRRCEKRKIIIVVLTEIFESNNTHYSRSSRFPRLCIGICLLHNSVRTFLSRFRESGKVVIHHHKGAESSP